MKFKFDKILKNKIVLYLTFFLALVTIFGYLVKQNYQAILFFTLVLFLTKHFSNNMIIILGVSIIATNLLDLFRVFSSSYLEGMQPGNKDGDTSKNKDDDNDDNDDNDDLPKINDNDLRSDTSTSSHEPIEDHSLTDKKKDHTPGSSTKNDNINKKPKTKTDRMTNLNPANLGGVNNPGSGNLNNFNDAKMKEMAFDNLDKILGSDGMRSLSNEANSLNEKQNAIMGQLKDIGPVISQAMNLIKNVDMDAINNVSTKMTGMINNLQDLKSKQ